MGFLIRSLRQREVEMEEGERYPEVREAEGKGAWLSGYDGRRVEVKLFLAQGPPSLRGVAVRVLGGFSQQPARGGGRDASSAPPALDKGAKLHYS